MDGGSEQSGRGWGQREEGGREGVFFVFALIHESSRGCGVIENQQRGSAAADVAVVVIVGAVAEGRWLMRSLAAAKTRPGILSC